MNLPVLFFFAKSVFFKFMFSWCKYFILFKVCIFYCFRPILSIKMLLKASVYRSLSQVAPSCFSSLCCWSCWCSCWSWSWRCCSFTFQSCCYPSWCSCCCPPHSCCCTSDRRLSNDIFLNFPPFCTQIYCGIETWWCQWLNWCW